jgi:nitroimidazol reductase NimA-like FMN-containing flavoprotein (pyridoxamine 5'-phosphate oxidase superfamily)
MVQYTDPHPRRGPRIIRAQGGRPLRRADREIADRKEIEDILRKSTVCRLALIDAGRPYLVPLCFGYDAGVLYFHSAPAGRKIDLLKQNRTVCFEFDADTLAVPADTSCGWTMRYRSVIGYGVAGFVEDPGEKRAALDIIMRQYAEGTHEYSDESLRKTAVIKVEIREISGKKSGY